MEKLKIRNSQHQHPEYTFKRKKHDCVFTNFFQPGHLKTVFNIHSQSLVELRDITPQVTVRHPSLSYFSVQ